MGTSSHSTKRKRSKHSALGRTKKRSKTRRARSKKLRCPHDLDSCSTDDLRSLVSVSSTSEDSYKSRKSRSRIRKAVKGAKRRVRSNSSSSKESHRFRKHKRSSRKNDSEVKEKSRKHKKKKAQRDASISSRSCSTCECTGESSDESEYERHRGRSERRGDSLRKTKNVKRRSQKRRYRSRRCSSCSRHSGGSDYWSQEKVTDGNISKRLRSVIILTKNDEEERELDCSQHKEATIYESGGYPSDRSNDSNDGESKRDLGDQSHEASEKQRPIENEKREDASVFNVKTAKVEDTCKDGGDHYVESQPSFGVFGTGIAIEEKSNEIHKANLNVNAEDMEVILRQKALENLRRFRGGMCVNESTPNSEQDESNDASKSLSPRKADLSQSESAKDDGAQGVGRDFVHSVEEKKILERRNGGNIYVSVKKNASLPSKVDVASKATVNTTFGHGINKQRLVKSALKQALSNASIPVMRSPASPVSSKVKLVSGSSVGDHNATSFSGSVNSDEVSHATHAVSVKSSSCLASEGRDIGLNKLQDEDNEETNLEQTMVTSLEPVSGGGNDNKVNDECGSNSAEPSSRVTSAIKGSESGPDDGKEGSQLQKKTMSVMRGGEMVQVSYKVYIPKKAPALARRQLKR